MGLEQIAVWAVGLVVFGALLVMQWNDKLPSVKSLSSLASVINSQGGHIFVLGVMSLIFFWASLHFTYWIIGSASGGKIDASNALAMAAFTFMTGSAFGGAFTSMVKSMTGGESLPPNVTNDNGATGTNTLVPGD